jgi:hypothetical protein
LVSIVQGTEVQTSCVGVFVGRMVLVGMPGACIGGM